MELKSSSMYDLFYFQDRLQKMVHYQDVFQMSHALRSAGVEYLSQGIF
jgi:hypothetical protein